MSDTKEVEAETILFYEYEAYFNYEKLYNLKLSKKENGILFQITYGDGFGVNATVQEKITDLFDQAEKGYLALSMLPFTIYRTMIQPKNAPEKLFIFKTHDRIAERKKPKINYENRTKQKSKS